jgi:putative membrane protein
MPGPADRRITLQNILTMKFIMRIIVTSVVAFGLSYILKGIKMDSFWTAIILAVVLAVLNAILKPILIILTFPITIVTFGLFLFVINAAMILLADNLIEGFKVEGFWWALLFSLLLSIVTSVLYKEEPEQRKDNR